MTIFMFSVCDASTEREMRTHSRVMANLELPIFKMINIAEATNHFSNKIGEGGFGPVYKVLTIT